MARLTTTTTPIPPNQSSNTTFIALSAGTAVLAVLLVVAIVVLIFTYRRCRKRVDAKSKKNVHVQGKADDVRNGPNKMNGNEYSSPINQTPGNYMDLEGTGDDIYHTIDEYGLTRDSRYAEVSDIPPPSTEDDTRTADHFILEERSNTRYQETDRPHNVDIESDDAPPTGEYFVLTKEDDHSSSPNDDFQQTTMSNQGHLDTSALTTPSYSDNYFVLDKQDECVHAGINAGTDGSQQEPTDEDYDVLHNKTSDDGADDYSHARVITTSNNDSLHNQNPLDDDYDRLKHKHTSETVTDYDRLDNTKM